MCEFGCFTNGRKAKQNVIQTGERVNKLQYSPLHIMISHCTPLYTNFYLLPVSRFVTGDDKQSNNPVLLSPTPRISVLVSYRSLGVVCLIAWWLLAKTAAAKKDGSCAYGTSQLVFF